MRRIRVVNTFPLGERDRARLEAISARLEIVHRPLEEEHEGLAPVADADAEVLFSSLTPDRARLPALRWLQLASAGVEHLGLDPDWSRELVVTNASGAYTVPIAEYVMAALLHASQELEARRRNQVERGWPPADALKGRLLRGSTVAIVGYGSIGREVARLTSSFGMRVLAVKARPEVREERPAFREPGTGDPEGALPERVLPLEQLAAAATEADYLVLCLPATPRTRGLVDLRALTALGPHGWLVNVGRGATVDEAALAQALREGLLGGAVLDVFDEEPLPRDSPFWQLPNARVTPHVSGFGARWDVLADLLVENLRHYEAGRPLLNQIDLERGY